MRGTKHLGELANVVAAGERAWRSEEPFWGIWHLSEAELRLLPEDMSGMRAVELGCGTAYVSSWMARRGAEVVGIDNSERQLATAARLAEEHGVALTLHHGNAEAVPYADESFDFAISEYGAAIWCDPYRWLPEAARVLRPGGRLAFLGNSVLLVLCMFDDDAPASDRLQSPQFGMHRCEWPPDPSVEFHISHGDRIRLLRDCGFEVENLIELKPPVNAEEARYPFVSLDWARQWPIEEAWVVRKTG